MDRHISKLINIGKSDIVANLYYSLEKLKLLFFIITCESGSFYIQESFGFLGAGNVMKLGSGATDLKRLNLGTENRRGGVLFTIVKFELCIAAVLVQKDQMTFLSPSEAINIKSPMTKKIGNRLLGF